MVGVHWGSLQLLLPHHVHFVNNRLLRWFSRLIKMPPVLGGDQHMDKEQDLCCDSPFNTETGTAWFDQSFTT